MTITARCPNMLTHVEYASEMLARNMVTIHELADQCTAFHHWPCGDHWHVGHKTKAAGDWCKAHSPGRPKRG